MRFLLGASFSEGVAIVSVSRTTEGGSDRIEIGFVNPAGQWAIPPNPSRFSWADDFHEGLALARSEATGNKLGFIGRRGQWVITPQFDWAEPFSEGVAAVDIGGMSIHFQRASLLPTRSRASPSSSIIPERL